MWKVTSRDYCFGTTPLIWGVAIIDASRMPIKCPTSGGQACNQEAAVQRTFHLERSIDISSVSYIYERSSFFYLLALMVRTQRSTYYCILHTAALNRPRLQRPMKYKAWIYGIAL